MSGTPTEEDRRMTGDSIELESARYHRNGSNDYSNWGTTIVEVVDRNGVSHTLGSHQDWHELAPGITARADGRGVRVRIARAACPVRVRYQSFNEYVSWDNYEHNSYWTTNHWVRYLAGE
jgi:hypothetical protein